MSSGCGRAQAETLRDAWARTADAWVEWARTPGHDTYFWDFNLPAFLSILPAPSGVVVDVGCGEGRVARRLISLGHRVIGVDSSPRLALAARTADPPFPVVIGDAARLPLADGSAELLVAFMSYQDLDDLAAAISEAARVLRPGGRLCMATLHPLSTTYVADGNGAWRCNGAYFPSRRFREELDRNYRRMEFNSMHHALGTYCEQLGNAGFVIEAIREPRVSLESAAKHPDLAHWRDYPLYLHFRARLVV